MVVNNAETSQLKGRVFGLESLCQKMKLGHPRDKSAIN